jgi:hypothetical protein
MTYTNAIAERVAEIHVLNDCNAAGMLDDVTHVATLAEIPHIFFHSGDIERRRAACVRIFGPDKLESYYMSCGELALRYTHASTGVDAVYRTPDVEATLAAISNGKCRLVTTTDAAPSTTTTIVCDMGDTDD